MRTTTTTTPPPQSEAQRHQRDVIHILRSRDHTRSKMSGTACDINYLNTYGQMGRARSTISGNQNASKPALVSKRFYAGGHPDEAQLNTLANDMILLQLLLIISFFLIGPRMNEVFKPLPYCSECRFGGNSLLFHVFSPRTGLRYYRIFFQAWCPKTGLSTVPKGLVPAPPKLRRRGIKGT